MAGAHSNDVILAGDPTRLEGIHRSRQLGQILRDEPVGVLGLTAHPVGALPVGRVIDYCQWLHFALGSRVPASNSPQKLAAAMLSLPRRNILCMR